MRGGSWPNVPAELAASHRRHHGEAGDRWVAGLSPLAEDLLQRWDLRVDGASAHGAVALVVPVLRSDGTRAVLKLQPVDDETVGEPLALRSWAGRGAVRLLEDDPASGSMLLERLDASRSLTTEPDDLAAAGVIADLLARLGAVDAPPGIRQLPDVLAPTLERADVACAQLIDPAESGLLRACQAVTVELLREPVGHHLLHWDLHYANVLARLSTTDDQDVDGHGESDQDRDHRGAPSWVAIDPKPLSGDLGFDLLPALWNRWDDVTATADPRRHLLRRFDLMTERLRLDRPRAASWTLARVLQNAVWDLADLGEARLNPEHRAIAETLVATLR